MSFVLDASIAASWAFQDEEHADSALALTSLRTREAYVPTLWWYEVRNTLIMGERRGRISVSQTALFLTDLDHRDIRTDHIPNTNDVFAIARQFRLTIYDAAYLELARRVTLPLSTLDAALKRAAAQAGVSLTIATP